MTKQEIERRIKELERNCCCSLAKYATFAAFPLTGSTSKLYLDLSTGDLYFWDGDSYESAGGSGVGGETLPISISFTESVPFTHLRTFMTVDVSESLLFIPDTAGAETILRIRADGVNIPSFGADFHKLTTSDNYNNTEDRIHLISFVYDGTDYHYSIAQSYTDSPYDPESDTFFAATGITDDTQRNAIDALVIELKAASIWTKIRALYPLVGGTAAKHKYNLKDPQDTNAAYRLSFSGTWTHSSTGAASNGTDAYADTHFDPSTDFTNGNVTMGFYRKSGTSMDTGGNVMGADDVTGRAAIILGVDIMGSLYSNSTASDYDLYVMSGYTGFFMAGINSNVLNAYKNGVALVGNGATSFGSGFPNQPIYIGGLNASGSLTDPRLITLSIALMADHLTAGEQSDLYDAVLTYQTALGRN